MTMLSMKVVSQMALGVSYETYHL